MMARRHNYHVILADNVSIPILHTNLEFAAEHQNHMRDFAAPFNSPGIEDHSRDSDAVELSGLLGDLPEFLYLDAVEVDFLHVLRRHLERTLIIDQAVRTPLT